MQILYHEGALTAFTFLVYAFYFYQVFAFSDSVFEGSKFKINTRMFVSIINSILVTVFFTKTLYVPLMVVYLVFFSLLGLNFLFFYRAKYINKLFFVSAYIMHFMCLSSITMAVYSSILGISFYEVAYSIIPMLHTIIIIPLFGGSAIVIVRKIIPAVELKIINNHNVQLYFLIIWISVFNILMFANANVFSIKHPVTALVVMQIILPIAVLIGLYVVLFFVIQTGKLLGYKDQALILQNEIIESKKAQQELQIKAERDPLTKLYNKEVTQVLIDDYIYSHKNESLNALFLIDLDNFKSANDQRGHIFGDELLVEVSKKLTHLFRIDDVVGRIGGDEFMVFMKNIVDVAGVESKANEICKALHISFENKNKTMSNISSSVGISLFPGQAKTYADLYQKADIALYMAKEKGKDTYVIYTETN